jgi:simple sugar transport system ATP-binding protein
MTPVTAPPAAPLVELSGVGKSYGNIRALHGVDLTVRPGRVSCVLGDNGAGKSTLIKIISGLHQHDEGEFRIDGERVRLGGPRAALDRGIAAVYQDLATVTLMPVWRNFFLGSELTRGRWPFQRLDIRRMKQLADAELRAMGIALDDLDQTVGSLSGGQRQSVAIARAILFDARILIMDEPTAALGPQETAQVGDLVKELKRQGIGIFLISHDIHDVFDLADRVYVMKNGRLVGTVAVGDATKDEVLGMIILGKCPPAAIPGPGAAI